MGTIANAKVTHYYNCYNGDFIGCLQQIILGRIYLGCCSSLLHTTNTYPNTIIKASLLM